MYSKQHFIISNILMTPYKGLIYYVNCSDVGRWKMSEQ